MKLQAEPQLFVTDMTAALDHYGDRLGFRVAAAHGEPLFWVQLERDGARLNLRHVDGPVFAPGFRETERDAVSATLTTDDPEGLFAAFDRAGVAFHQPLKTEPWGARTFIVGDPDGNLILFAG